MKTKQFLVGGITLIVMLTLAVGLSQAQAPRPEQVSMPLESVGNAFTYQGQLKDGSNPANGEYDFQFMLYNSLSGGSQVGSTVTKDNVTVANGLFSVALDFGSVFDGTGLWLEAGVRLGNSTGIYTILSPRQEITPAPYALYALSIPNHDHLGENWSGSQTNALIVQTDNVTDGARAIYGKANGANGMTLGVVGQSGSTSGRGVYGYATSPTGTTIGVYGRAKSPGGYGGYFENDAGGYALYVGNDVRQAGEADGLVKAAVFASVGTGTPTIHRYFNTVNDHVSIWACSAPVVTGHSCLDFDFDLSGRFWVGMAYNGGYVSCIPWAATNDTLNCWRYNAAGNLESGDIMVLVY